MVVLADAPAHIATLQLAGEIVQTACKMVPPYLCRQEGRARVDRHHSIPIGSSGRVEVTTPRRASRIDEL